MTFPSLSAPLVSNRPRHHFHLTTHQITSQGLLDLRIFHLHHSLRVRLLLLLIRLQLRPQALRVLDLGDFAEEITCGDAEGFEAPDVAGFGEVFVECAARKLSERGFETLGEGEERAYRPM